MVLGEHQSSAERPEPRAARLCVCLRAQGGALPSRFPKSPVKDFKPQDRSGFQS